MPRKKVTFRQSDLTRAAKGLAAAGAVVTRVEIDPSSGKIVITTSAGASDGAAIEESPLQKWRRKNGPG